MRHRRIARSTIAVAAVAAALTPAAASAVPPSLGPPTGMDLPAEAESAPEPQPVPEPQEEAPVAPQEQEQAPPAARPVNAPPEAVVPPPAEPAKLDLLISRSGNLERNRLRIRLRCATSGGVRLKATGPGRLTGTRLGRASFVCKRGEGLATVHLRRKARRKVSGVSLFTVEVAARMDGRTEREEMAISRTRQTVARAASGQYWTNAGFASCKTGAYHPYQELMINFYASEWSTVYWRPWVLMYTDADGMYWYQPSAYEWYGPFGATLTTGDFFRVRFASGYQQYAVGAIEVWDHGSTDWNYLNQTFPEASEHYGEWCYIA